MTHVNVILNQQLYFKAWDKSVKGVIILMPGTTAEGISEKLKKFLNPRKHLAKSFGTPTWSLKKLWYPSHKAQNSSKIFVPLWQLYNSFRTPDIKQKQNLKELNQILFKNDILTIPKQY